MVVEGGDLDVVGSLGVGGLGCGDQVIFDSVVGGMVEEGSREDERTVPGSLLRGKLEAFACRTELSGDGESISSSSVQRLYSALVSIGAKTLASLFQVLYCK